MVKNEKKTLLVIGGISLFLAGGGGFGIHYAYGKIGAEQEQIGKIKKELDVAKAKIKKIRKLEDAVIILRENVQDYAKILPDEREVTDYARTLARYIANAGMVLLELSPNQRGGTKGKGFATIRYSLKMTGTVWQTMRLVSYLENHPRFMEVKSLKVRAEEKEDGAQVAFHRVDMTVETYTYKKGKGGAGTVKIANYAQKKANLEHEIHKRRVRFDRQAYSFTGDNGRRDVFVDPRFDASLGGGENRVPREQQKEILTTCKAALGELVAVRKRYESESNIIIRMQLNAHFKAAVKKLQTLVEENESKISYPPYRSQFAKFIKDPLTGMPADLSQKKGRVEEPILSLQDLSKVKKRMENLLGLGDMEGAIQAYREAQGDLEKTGKSPAASAAQKRLVGEMATLNKRAKVAREFSTIKLQITGRIIQEKKDSIVIINNKTYMEGDDITDELFIHKIAKNHIEFLFKGVLLKKYQ